MQHGTASIAREPFVRTVAATTAFAQAAGDNRAALRFAFGDKLTFSAAIEERGEGYRGSAAVTVDVAASTMREPRDVGFSGPYVLDILKSLAGRQVSFEFFDVGGPNSFTGVSSCP